MPRDYDFSGWATRNNLVCSDGRIIEKDAFIKCDGKTVPLVWNHMHDGPANVLGHALLENADDGVRAYCTFNDTENGQMAKALVDNGDMTALSIYANNLKQDGPRVRHGMIREVSLVYAGANPGAMIDSVIRHGEESEEEGIIFTGEELVLCHADDDKSEGKAETKEEKKMPNETKEKTIQDVIDSMTDEQKEVMYGLIGMAIEDAQDGKKSNEDTNKDEEVKHYDFGGDEMKHNVFDDDTRPAENVLTHSDMEMIIKDAKRTGSLKESFLAHADGIEYPAAIPNGVTSGPGVSYGIHGLDFLFPEARNLNNPPEWIKRDTGWVSVVMNGVHHTPFSRIKSQFADITEDAARAKGYIKGKQKKEQVFSLLKRTTTPQTVYKKQKMDRDDIIDITDFDVVSWIKGEMRGQLDEELARAFLIGDGRLASDDDKISEDHIRPVWTDADLFTIKAIIDANDIGRMNTALGDGANGNHTAEESKAKAFIRAAVRSRKNYKGSGNPIMFTTEDIVTECLLLEDNNGRPLYDSLDKLATALRVSRIVTVEVMENASRTADNYKYDLMALILNLNDYSVGADKGGAVELFDDFDIDYNAYKYLIETRCSGALVKPYSAIAVEYKTAVESGNVEG